MRASRHCSPGVPRQRAGDAAGPGEGAGHEHATSVWQASPMSAALRPIDLARLPAWIERSRDEYTRDLIAVGKLPEVAAREAAEGMAESFPNGRPSPGHAVFDVVDDSGAP